MIESTLFSLADVELPQKTQDQNLLKELLIGAYAEELLEHPPVRSCRIDEVGEVAATRNAKAFAKKDITRFFTGAEKLGIIIHLHEEGTKET